MLPGNSPPMAPPGLLCHASPLGPRETMERLVAAVTSSGMTVFARIDHGAGAAAVGQALRPTELLVFGHARGGTSMMQAAQTIGIDLPLKALVWQDEAGRTWLGFNDPGWIAGRHGFAPGDVPAVAAMTKALAAITQQVVGAAERLTSPDAIEGGACARDPERPGGPNVGTAHHRPVRHGACGEPGVVDGRFGLDGGGWRLVQLLDDNLNALGLVIISVFVTAWVIAAAINRRDGRPGAPEPTSQGARA